MIINKLGIREQNEAAVLKAIIENKNISRAEISTLTNLNKASVSQIIKKLIETDFVKEVGIGDSTSIGGRKPIKLQFNQKNALAISFDIGYNYIKGVLAFINGEYIHSISKDAIKITRSNVLSTIDEMMLEFFSYAPKTPNSIVGIALAIHGIVNDQKIIFTPYYDLANSDLISPIEEKYDIPVFIENEANLTAIGEYCFNGSFNSLVSLSIHSGIGAGIVTDGNIQSGKHGFAGEIGHSILYPGGKNCPCGNHGCLEQYASNKVLFDQFADLYSLDLVNSDIFAAAYHDGNKHAVEMADTNLQYLSIGINNIVTLFNPEIIIINSSVYRKIPHLIERMKLQFHSKFTQSVTIQNSKLAEFAPMYGGISIIAQNFLNIDHLKFPNPKKLPKILA